MAAAHPLKCCTGCVMLQPMPTKNPRISVTLTPESAAILAQIAKLSNGSVSSLVGELIETTRPVFERMAHALEAAALLENEANAAKQDIAAGLQRAQDRLETQLGLALDSMDDGLRPILEQAEKVSRRAARTPRRPREAEGPRGAEEAAPAVSTPVPVTRGSGTPKRGKPGGGKGGRRAGV